MVTESVYVNGLSIIAPGMVEQDKAIAILCGEQQWQPEPLPKIIPSLLPVNERRRTTPLIKLALQTIQPLLNDDDDLERTATVFASSDGDSGIEDKICRALALPEKAVSPTQFHNSVHNAAAGYWAIASSMKAGSVSLSAGDGTFAAGLVEATTNVIIEKQSVLFVAYDVIAPEPIDAVRHFDYSLGIALRLGLKQEPGNFGNIKVSIKNRNVQENITVCKNNSLNLLRAGNPIGAGLPLMEVLAKKTSSLVVMPYVMGNQLEVEVSQ